MKTAFQVVSFLSVLTLLAPVMVFAMTAPPTGTEPPAVGNFSALNLFNILDNVVNWVFVFIILLSIIFVIMAAFEFVSGGPTKVDEARQKLIWAAVGIGFAILARAFPNILRTLIL